MTHVVSERPGIAVTPAAPGDLAALCLRLRALPGPGAPLVVPNAWDVASARAIAGTGLPVVGTTSTGVAAVLGYSDHEQAPRGQMLAAAARITGAVDVPVTVDAEAGYGMTAAELVQAHATPRPPSTTPW